MTLRTRPHLSLTQAQRRYVAEQKAERRVQKFRALVTRCDVCGRESRDAEVHEIPRGGGDRLRARGFTWACLLLCGGLSKQQCHARMGGMPRARQLAYVYLAGRLRMGFYNRLFKPMVPVEDVMREVKNLTQGIS